MHWYYVKNGEKAGPIADRDLQGFIEKGEITDDTLVWNETMKDWAPYGEIPSTLGGSLAQAAVVNGPTCSMCGKEFSEDQLIEFEGSNVCAGCKPEFIQQIKENAEISGEVIMEYIGFWQRFAAVFIDGIIMYIANLPFSIVFGILTPMVSNDGAPGAAFWIGFVLMYLFQILVPALYSILMLGKYGATLGKKALGIKVVLSDGSPITYGRATGRYFAHILSGMILYIGYIMVAFDDQKRALHDHICNTRVIKAR